MIDRSVRRAWLIAMLAIASMLGSIPSSAQWRPLQLPAGATGVVPYDTSTGRVLLAVVGAATTSNQVLHVSADGGASWKSTALPSRLLNLFTRPDSNGAPGIGGDLYGSFLVGGDGFGSLLCELRKSSDVGASWTVVSPISQNCIVTLDPSSSEVMYAIGLGNGGQMWFGRTLDGGKTWSDARGLSLWVGRARVGPDGTVYTLRGDLYASRDHGDTWTKLPLAGQAGVGINDVQVGRNPRTGIIALVAATTNGLFQSVDQGTTWTPAGLQGYEIGYITAAVDTAQTPRIVVFRGGMAWWREDSVPLLLDGLPAADPGPGVSVDGHYAWRSGITYHCADLMSCIGGSLYGTASLVEFHDPSRDHYFMTLEGAEAAAVDRGDFGPWQRTGESFRVYVDAKGRPSSIGSACRFYGTPGIGPRSHFYTVSLAECMKVQGETGWTLETTTAFGAPSPPFANNSCGSSRPIYRLYNKRFAQNDSNHRYVSDVALYQAMQAQGWKGEGIQLCEVP